MKEPEDYEDEEDISVEINIMQNNNTNTSTIKAKDELCEIDETNRNNTERVNKTSTIT